MSASPPKADIGECYRHVRLVPKAGIKLFQPSSKYLLTLGGYFNIC